MVKVLTVKNLFSLFLIVWFAYGVWEAHGYAFLARIFPFYISFILLFFALISIIIDIRKAIGEADDLPGQSSGSDLSVDWEIPMSVVWKRFGLYVGIIAAVYVLIYLIGYPLTMSVFIALFYRLIAKAKWISSLIAGCAGLAFLALASHLLSMEWPAGLITLPWPFG